LVVIVTYCFVVVVTQDKAKKERFRQKITQYMDRAEQLKLFVTETKNGMYCLYKNSFLISSIIMLKY
jgi:phosphopantetheine adenylyltransferase